MQSILFVSLYGLGFFALLSTAIIGAFLWARNLAQERNKIFYKVRNSKGIDVLAPVEIGGHQQWLHIRGRNRDNPVLLFFHGGPGMSHIGFYDETQRPWEEYFTVVQWDQRHTGKSYDIPLKEIEKTITHEQILNDAEEVIAYLRSYLNKEKIFIMGFSYGTCLGMKMAKRRPEWLYGYIGVGQLVNLAENVREEHALLLGDAKSKNNKELVAKLEAMMPVPDPNNKMRYFLEHEYYIGQELVRAGKSETTVEEALAITKFGFLTSPHYTLSNLFHIPPMRFISEGSKFGEDFMDINLPAEVGSSFKVPIIFMTGANDWHVPYTLTDAWFKEIEAPFKEQIWFEDSSHFHLITEPGKFLVALVTKVLPLAQEKKSQEKKDEKIDSKKQ